MQTCIVLGNGTQSVHVRCAPRLCTAASSDWKDLFLRKGFTVSASCSQAAAVNMYEPLCTLAFCCWMASHPRVGGLQQRRVKWVTNTQAQGRFRRDETFKVLFILYIQYTSQKYRVNRQQRASRGPLKSASGNQVERKRTK